MKTSMGPRLRPALFASAALVATCRLAGGEDRHPRCARRRSRLGEGLWRRLPPASRPPIPMSTSR